MEIYHYKPPVDPNFVTGDIGIYDIDQTLAGGIVKAHLMYYDPALGLNLTQQEIDKADINYLKTFDHPAIKGYRLTDGGEPKFQAERHKIRTSPEVHLNLTPIPGSIDGILDMMAHGIMHGGYYTVRPLEVEPATRRWLENHGYPNHTEVVMCETPQDKLEKIIGNVVLDASGNVLQGVSRVFLVDDSVPDLTKAALKIAEEKPEIAHGLKHLLLLGFGLSEDKLMEGSINLAAGGLRTIAFPSWQLSDRRRALYNIPYVLRA